MTSVIPVNNIINVTVTSTPSGLSERNVNNVAIFTEETPSNIDPFRQYISAQQVADDYGTASKTAQMANAIFAQAPNIRSGNGNLTIIPLQAAVAATEGTFETADLTSNLTALQAVSDGDIRVTLNGTNIDLTGVDFTSATDLDDVASILGQSLPNVNVTQDAGVITLEAKTVGDDSDVVLAQLPAGSGTDLSSAGLLNVAGGTTTSGADSSGETILDAIARVEDSVSFTGFVTSLNLEDAAVTAIATAVQATDRIFLHHFADTGDIAGFATTNKDAGNDQTRPLLYTPGQDAANLMKCAYLGRAFSVNTRGAATAQTMNLEQLATINTDPGINQTLFLAAETAGIDIYVSIDGVPSVISTGGNDYFDNVYLKKALKFALETAGFNYLRQTNTKVPQTEAGIDGLKNAYTRAIVRFVTNGFIAPGNWNSSEIIGTDPVIFRENITQNGYYVYSQPVAQQDPVEREQRKAPLVQIGVKLAGAVHSSDVQVVVNE